MIMFSIIVPIYNCEKYIAQCIKSVESQSYQSYELIIVNDGSYDKSLMICESFAYLNSKIKVTSINHMGVAKARNAGIKMAIGEYILFLDADDFYNPDYLSELHSIFIKKKYDICFTNEYYQFSGIDTRLKIKLFSHPKLNNLKEYIFEYTKIKSIIPGAILCNCYKAEIIKTNHLLFDETYIWSEDLDFFFRVMLKVKTANCCKKPHYYYRNDNVLSATNSVNVNKISSRIRVYKKWISYWSNNKEYEGVLYHGKLISDFYYMLTLVSHINIFEYYKSNLKNELKTCNKIFESYNPINKFNYFEYKIFKFGGFYYGGFFVRALRKLKNITLRNRLKNGE